MAGNEHDLYGGAQQSEPVTAADRRSNKHRMFPYIVTAIIAMWVGGFAALGYYLSQVSPNAVPEALNEMLETPRVADAVPAPYPQWVVDVRGGGHEEFFEDLCRGVAFVERYADFAKPVAPAGELSADTNLPDVVGSLKVRNYALVVARNLYQTFSFRHSSRLHLCILTTLSPWSFYDGHDLMKVLLRVMQTTNLTPADLGADVDAKAMREILIGDLRDQLQEYRDAPRPPVDSTNPIEYVTIIAQWQASWNLTPQELFLQTQEIAALEELAAQDRKERAGVMPPR